MNTQERIDQYAGLKLGTGPEAEVLISGLKLNDMITVCRQAKELQQLFDLQWTRMADATKLWREATGRHDVSPDLGDLLKWLMERFTEHTGHVEAFLSEMRCIMIDPLEEGQVNVAETCAELKKRAVEDRDYMHRQDQLLADHREREAKMKSLEGMSLDEAGARIVFAEKQAIGLRKRIHQLDGHNQHFERCESRWCHPVDGDNPALEFAKDTAILNADIDLRNGRST